MAEYFTSDHFKLLNEWRGQKRDDTNPDQNRAYEELKKACEITGAWADQIRAALFPMGGVDIRKRPTNQGNRFAAYHWAKIYPSAEAPRELAYTASIDADHGFVALRPDHGLESYSTKHRKVVQESAFSKPDAYIGIYQALPI